MVFLKRIRQYRIYRRLFLSYLLLIVLSMSIVSTILYTLFSIETVKQIDISSKEMLSQVSYTSSLAYKQIQDLTAQLSVDNDIISFMYADKVNKLINSNANIIISKVQSIYPFLADISLYNFQNGEYVDRLGLPEDPLVIEQADRSFITFYPRKIRTITNVQLRLLSFRIVSDWQAITNRPQSAIVFDLNESYIQNTIGNINSSIKNANTFVIDASGQVLSHTNSEYFMKDFSTQDYIHRILSSSKKQGSFVQTLDHQKNLITYVKSSTLDWVFVTTRPYNELLSNLYTLRKWIFTVTLLLIVFGIVISLFVTANIYNPVRALVDRVTESRGKEIDEGTLLKKDEYLLLSNVFTKEYDSAKMMQSKLNHSKQLLKNGWIISHLNGQVKINDLQMEQEWKERLKGPYLRVILFKIDFLQTFRKSFFHLDRELILFAIGNIAQEILGKDYINEIATVEEEIIILIQSDHAGQHDVLYLLIAEIQDAIQMYYKITVSAGLGNWCDSLELLSNSYHSAQEYIGYRLIFGHSCIVDSSRVAQDSTTSLRYPSYKERKLIDSIKLCDLKSIQNDIMDWNTYISSYPSTQIIQYTNFLLLSIIREFENITEMWEVNSNNMYNIFTQIQQVETLEEIKLILLNFCTQIVTVLEESKTNISIIKNVKLMEEIKKIIQENFADVELTINYAADKTNLSSGYLGKMFKSLVKMTFNDYVTDVRITHAKRMLLESNESIGDIAARVGIPGVSYFSTVFKKHVGMSPSQYRDS
ncbi:helix-turn-helix domain-containing protein [Paenibacillus psychroresistens]|uniref:helix-turn-helix domain-containing protein n=1 Tax=Paenibacillus psychroresistens TaxID=1778678 RepID=UPI001D03AA6A|nr:helix-turn-helix domain-containing protein [Paenibacillus psychroresistens]